MEKGYSWKTNQYGLTIDNIESFELVLPNGTIETVTSKNEDLWFGLRVSHIVTYKSLYCMLRSLSGRL